MKLLIDIPDYKLDEVQNGSIASNEILKAVRKGTPYEERPHGEWNYIQANMCICPFCGAMPHTFYKDFCAKCGADMRPEKKIQTPSCLTNPERQAELLERYKEE